VTPLTIDPTVAPCASTLTGPAFAGRTTLWSHAEHPILQTEPSVPPPRA